MKLNEIKLHDLSCSMEINTKSYQFYIYAARHGFVSSMYVID